jgi:phosphotransferase system HPr-like phosphotransfer protein
MSIILPIITEYNDKGVKNAQTSLMGLTKSYLATGAAATTIAAVLKRTVTSASNLSETVNKSNVIFGASANSIREFASTASTAFGQSQQQALEAAATFALFGKSAGLAGEDLVTFSTDFVTLASDLASFNNTTPQDAIEAIGAALRGEAEPIRRYNVLLSDAVLKNRALEMKIYDGSGALTSQQKILATQAEIFIQADSALGDFSRTADGFANSTKTLTAQIEDLSAAAGQKLLPVMEDLALITKTVAGELKTSDGEASNFAKGLGVFAGAALPVVGVVKSIGDIIGFTADKIRDASGAVLNSAADFRKFDQQMSAKYNKTLGISTNKTLGLTTSTNKAKDAANKLADATKTKLTAALDAAKNKVQSLKDESANLAASIRDQVSGFVSLSDAVNTSQSAEDNYNEALKERAEAYAKLNKLEAERQRRGFGANDQVTYDAQEYAQALIDVAAAEGAVSSAQSKRVNYSQKFAEDIAAASQFAGKLKTLSERGLGQAGIQQLLNLGPVAGNQVATDLINGTGPMTLEGLRGSLAGLAAAGQGLGDVTAGGVFGTAIAGAQAEVNALNRASVSTVQNNVNINVSGADPQAVVDALKKWMKTNGSIPIKVTNK